jgi:enoyl-CoA hydratase
LVTTLAADKALAASYFAGEYQLNWLLDCFSKPTVSLVDGLCMGSGAGLTLYNTHRVAGENYKFAMPETAIGLFPDVGVAHPLSRLPWPLGLYLGLTGRTVGRADGYWLGLATHCIGASQFDGIIDQLAASEPIDPLLDGLHEEPPAGPLQTDMAMIEDLFSGGSIVEIMQRLKTTTGVSADFAKASYANLARRSPMSLAITDSHIRSARHLDLRETLIQDYRLAIRCLNSVDFSEGVRAALVDKDGAPKWQHARLEDVTADEVACYFAPLGLYDLNLLTRAEMQIARV